MGNFLLVHLIQKARDSWPTQVLLDSEVYLLLISTLYSLHKNI